MNIENHAGPAATAQSEHAGRYLTVVLDQESYGIAVLQVREIVRLPKITPVPQMPGHVKGVVNLRGRIIPVVDLRLKFGLRAEYADRTCVVVVQIRVASGPATQMGLVVDSVEEVVNIPADQIDAVPEFGARVDVAYLRGIAKIKGQVKTLLDIERVISADAAGVLQAA